MLRLAMGLLIIAMPAAAQPALQPPAPPHVQVLEQRLIAATGDAIQWQTRVVELQAKVDELQRQLAEAGKNPEQPVAAK